MALFTAAALATMQVRAQDYADLFAAAAAKYQLPVQLLEAIAAHESSMLPGATSPTNDFGLMQINASNYDGDPQDLVNDVALNIDLGAKIMSQAIQHAAGDVRWAISAYNRGFGSWQGQSLTSGRLSDGSFPNQAYVDDVVQWFQALLATSGLPTDVAAAVQQAGLGGGAIAGIVLGLGLLGALLWRWTH